MFDNDPNLGRRAVIVLFPVFFNFQITNPDYVNRSFQTITCNSNVIFTTSISKFYDCFESFIDMVNF